MALVIKDRVLETSSTTGTGTLTLAGAVSGYQSFASAIGAGNTTYYTILANGGTDWEVGLGTVGSGTLARTTVYASSNAGSLVNFTTPTYVWGDMPASRGVYLDANGNVCALGTISSGTWNGTAIGIDYGGTGQTTQQSAINALTGTQTSGYYLRSDGTNASLSALSASDLTGTINGGSF